MKNLTLGTLTAFVVLLLGGCYSEGDTRTYIELGWYCSPDSAEKRAAFVLKCIENANPKSDEEPEDWFPTCHEIAYKTYCSRRQFRITEVYREGIFHMTEKRVIPESDQ